MPISIADRLFYQLVNFDLLDDITSIYTDHVPFAKTFIKKAVGEDYDRMMYKDDIKKQKEINHQMTGHPIIQTQIGPIMPCIPMINKVELVKNLPLTPTQMLFVQQYDVNQKPLITQDASREDIKNLGALQFIDENLLVGMIDMTNSKMSFIKVPSWFQDKYLTKKGDKA